MFYNANACHRETYYHSFCLISKFWVLFVNRDLTDPLFHLSHLSFSFFFLMEEDLIIWIYLRFIKSLFLLLLKSLALSLDQFSHWIEWSILYKWENWEIDFTVNSYILGFTIHLSICLDHSQSLDGKKNDIKA